MTVLKLHAMAVRERRRLERVGVECDVNPYGDPSAEVLEEYGGGPDNGRLPPEMWETWTFSCRTDRHRELLDAAEERLAEAGVCFDTGGGGAGRDWEMDWSFHAD